MVSANHRRRNHHPKPDHAARDVHPRRNKNRDGDEDRDVDPEREAGDADRPPVDSNGNYHPDRTGNSSCVGGTYRPGIGHAGGYPAPDGDGDELL